jgi:hypothetical protein
MMSTIQVAVSRPAVDARASARVVPTSGLHVAINGLDAALQLHNLGFGGFAVIAPRPFWRGMTHRFTFACRSGFSVDLVAKAVHCYRMADGGQNRFISGWEFMAGSADKTALAIGKLIEAAGD